MLGKKEEYIINFCKEFYLNNLLLPKIKDFEKKDIWSSDIQYLFGNLSNLFKICEIKINKQSRPKNMNDDQFRKFLISIKKIDNNYDSLFSHRGIKSICFKECSCWTTDRFKSNLRGYLYLTYNKKYVSLHRLSYLLFKGQIEKGLVISHLCDNPSCFNPDHLEAISQKRNVEDTVKRNRRVYDNFKSAKTRSDRKFIKLKDPYDYTKLLQLVKCRIDVTNKNEWLYNKSTTRDGYPEIVINNKKYLLHRLILANKLGKKYEEIDIARHILSDGTKPQKNDVNPDHLFEGSKSDNAKDTFEYNKSIILTKTQIKEIKNEIIKYDFSKRGSIVKFDKIMAKQFNVSTDSVASIRRGKTFKND